MRGLSSPQRKNWVERLENSPYNANVKIASKPQQDKSSKSSPLKRKIEKDVNRECISTRKDNFSTNPKNKSGVRNTSYYLRPRKQRTRPAPSCTITYSTKLSEMLLLPTDLIPKPYLDSKEVRTTNAHDNKFINEGDENYFDEKYSDDDEYSREEFDGNSDSCKYESDVSTVGEDAAVPFNDDIVQELYIAAIHEQKKVALHKGGAEFAENSPPIVKLPPV